MVRGNTVLRRILIVVGLLSFCATSAFGQLILDQLPYQQPMLLNPSLVGSGSAMRVGMGYRNQWMNLSSPFNTMDLTYDMHFGLYRNHNVGMALSNDVQGPLVLQHIALNAFYAYMLDVTYNFRLRIGVAAGTILKLTDYNRLTFPDMLEEKHLTVVYKNERRFSPDVSFGIAGDINSWYFGFAVNHIVENSFDTRDGKFLRYPRRFRLHLRKDFNVFQLYRFKPPLYLSPDLMLSYWDRSLELNVGFTVEYQGIKASIRAREGLLFRAHQLSLGAGWQGKTFGIMYSYGMGLMPEGFYGLQASVHELSLNLNLSYANYSHLSRGGRKRYARYDRTRTGASRRRKYSKPKGW
ncbi:MAG: hypothetical protein CSA07_00330 [Bacteroidia bacterium]|nr:MAG: hypothetical protein CSA07_00330 [Bacteroidia bacterium]